MSINVVLILLVAMSTICRSNLVDAVPINDRAKPNQAMSQSWPHYWRSSTTLATFNTALIPVYPELETRTDIIIQKIMESDVDVWCLQEVFFADVHKKIYNAVKDHYPYVLSATDLTLDSESEAPACSPAMLQGLGACVQQALQTTCANVPESAQSGCILQTCARVVQSTLSDSCRQCVALILLTGNDVQAASTCATEPASRYIPHTYGLLMLSKYELTETSVEGFTAQSQFRGFLQATIRDVGNLICTHTSAFFGDVYLGPPITLPPLYESYDEQQYAELLRLFDVLVNLEEPILLGDFNHGPALPGNITWELPFHYGLMTSRGLVSPYVSLDGRCTWCGRGENVAAAANFPFDEVIDHIYLLTESLERVEAVMRILEGFTTPSGLPISDHYGVKMTLTDYTRDCSWWYYHYYCKPEPASLLKLPPPQNQLQGLCKAV